MKLFLAETLTALSAALASALQTQPRPPKAAEVPPPQVRPTRADPPAVPCTKHIFIGMKRRREEPDVLPGGGVGDWSPTCTWHSTYVQATKSIDCGGCVLSTLVLGHGPVRICEENVTVPTGTITVTSCAISPTAAVSATATSA